MKSHFHWENKKRSTCYPPIMSTNKIAFISFDN